MKLASLKLSGFRGARAEVFLEFPLGFTVVVGLNGSGKSTICDAIEFALTGAIRASSDHTEKGEGLIDYIWWKGTGAPKDRFVELTLLDDDGTRHVLRRTAARKNCVRCSINGTLACTPTRNGPRGAVGAARRACFEVSLPWISIPYNCMG